ncbi:MULTISPECIES: hypothetical protein [unclassified Microcoleus]|uniref:hypothetical protein n=1 Tax=unclassified Microcoleus TaxID=2642155 RepID=UPI002FD45A6C
MANLVETMVSIVIAGELAALGLLGATGLIGYAKVTAAHVQLVQTAKQSRYDAIVNYGQVRSVAVFTGENAAIAECLGGVCGEKISLPSGVKIESTFRGIDARVAGRAGSNVATLISWSSETNSGIGGSYGQHGTITFSHPWSRKKFCLVRGGALGNQGEVVIKTDKDCR